MLTRLFLVLFSWLAFAPTPVRVELPRVRALDPSIDALLAAGHARSPTFRTLVARLERSDVIVHIEPWPLSRRQRVVGGILRFATRAGGFRYLRITLGVWLPHNRAVALLGHELHHALEVANDRAVVDDVTFETLYRRIGDACRGASATRYDTAGAREVERLIMRELRGSSSGVVARR